MTILTKSFVMLYILIITFISLFSIIFVNQSIIISIILNNLYFYFINIDKPIIKYIKKFLYQ